MSFFCKHVLNLSIVAQTQLASYQAGGRYNTTGFEEPMPSSPPPLPAVLQSAIERVVHSAESVKTELATIARKHGITL